MIFCVLFFCRVGNDDNLIHTWKFLSQSTDSLHKISRVNESMESLVDEGKRSPFTLILEY